MRTIATLSFRAGGAPEGQSAARNPRPLAMLLLLALSTCTPNSENKDIVVGEYGSLTGSEATFGQSTHNGITLAVEEINAASGIGGRRIPTKSATAS